VSILFLFEHWSLLIEYPSSQLAQQPMIIKKVGLYAYKMKHHGRINL